jgi:hypothetical protein
MSQTPTAATQSKLISYASSLSTFTEHQAEKFPLNTFFSLQVFRLFYGGVDFIGGILEYPLSVLQLYKFYIIGKAIWKCFTL